MKKVASNTMSDFARKLIDWQRCHGRHDLPWQGSRDAYRIWVAEIMLQQTQVGTVIAYYERFLSRFPDVATLAAAAPEEVMALWSGLGYYARARNLQRCARCVVDRHEGHFPQEAEVIALLPGIGRSTAAAIAVFAFGLRAAILDGNVKRVLCRCHGIAGFPGDKAVEGELWALAETLLPERGIETYTQALMDLGATACTRATPHCAGCPLRDQCVAWRDGRVHHLPAPRPKRARPRRSCTVLVLLDGNRVLLEQRPPAGIWGGLLSLPELPEGAGSLAEALPRLFGIALDSTERLAPVRHGFTHFQLELRPLLCRVRAGGSAVHEDRFRWLPLDGIAAAALPAPIKKLLLDLAEPSLL